MTHPDLQVLEQGWLLLGFRGGREEQMQTIQLCRRLGGTVLFREGDVMVVEISGATETVNAFLVQLPGRCVTHFWQRGNLESAVAFADRPETDFCGI